MQLGQQKLGLLHVDSFCSVPYAPTDIKVNASIFWGEFLGYVNVALSHYAA